jgi:hypothetical protein
MRTRFATFFVLTCAALSAACSPPHETKPPADPRPVTLGATTGATTGATVGRSVDAGPTQGRGAIQLTVAETNGLSPALVTRAYEAAREPLRVCQQAGGGKVNVRIARGEGRFHLDVEPGASLDPTARHCVLEALSTVELEDTAGNMGGPTVKPSGFTSLITVSW